MLTRVPPLTLLQFLKISVLKKFLYLLMKRRGFTFIKSLDGLATLDERSVIFSLLY